MRLSLVLVSATALCLAGPAARDTTVSLRATWIDDSDLLRIAARSDVTDLDLSETRITDIGFQLLKPLRNVTNVNLYYAEQIGDGALAVMRDWKHLRSLNLRGTKMTDAGLVQLAGLPIESLDVGYSLFTDNGFEHLTNLPQLKRLAVGGNKITDVGLNSLRLLPNLKELDLSGSQRTDSGLWAASVTDRALDTLDSLTRLEELNARGSKFTDAGFPKLTRLKSLRRLDLGETQLSAKGLSGLANFPELEILSLYDSTKMDDEVLPNLKALPKLRWLDLTGTKISAAALESLRAAKPQCVILSGATQKSL